MFQIANKFSSLKLSLEDLTSLLNIRHLIEFHKCFREFLLLKCSSLPIFNSFPDKENKKTRTQNGVLAEAWKLPPIPKRRYELQGINQKLRTIFNQMDIEHLPRPHILLVHLLVEDIET